MLIRLSIALIALAGVTAFAPAPLPKQPRTPNAAELLKKMQGDYEATVQQRETIINGARRIRPIATRTTTRVRIQGNRWSYFTSINGRELLSTGYTIKLDTSKKPIQMELIQDAVPNAANGIPLQARTSMVGDLIFDGNSLKFSYDLSRTMDSNMNDTRVTRTGRTRVLELKRVAKP